MTAPRPAYPVLPNADAERKTLFAVLRRRLGVSIWRNGIYIGTPRLLEELRENSESGYACAVRLGLVGGEPGTDHGMDYEAGE